MKKLPLLTLALSSIFVTSLVRGDLLSPSPLPLPSSSGALPTISTSLETTPEINPSNVSIDPAVISTNISNVLTQTVNIENNSACPDGYSLEKTTGDGVCTWSKLKSVTVGAQISAKAFQLGNAYQDDNGKWVANYFCDYKDFTCEYAGLGGSGASCEVPGVFSSRRLMSVYYCSDPIAVTKNLALAFMGTYSCGNNVDATKVCVGGPTNIACPAAPSADELNSMTQNYCKAPYKTSKNQVACCYK